MAVRRSAALRQSARVPRREPAQRPRLVERGDAPSSEILDLQSAVGNQAVLYRLNAHRAASVQRFESKEHTRIGDEATGKQYVMEIPLASGPIKITYGEMVALSGDWFQPHDRPVTDPQDKDHVGVGLFWIAARPGTGGGGLDTADEIAFAIQQFNDEESKRHKEVNPIDTDPRFKGFKASDQVKERVKNRYRNLGAANGAHFVAPRGRDANGNINPNQPGETSAGSNYRSLHETALLAGYAAGVAKTDKLPAMAREAAAQHFLTDEFSAGHLRTPTADIRDHWATIYPLFWFNLREKISLDTASQMNAQDENAATWFGTVKMMFDEISAEIMKMTASYPEVSFGDLAAKIFHDYDNMVGVDIGGGARVFGDALLGRTGRQDDVTLTLAKEAVQAGNADIDKAYEIGMKSPGLDQAALFAAVQTQTGAPAGKYKPEAMVPTPSKDNGEQQWKAPNVETLWDQPMVSGGDYPAGKMISYELSPGSEIYEQLAEIGRKFPPEKRIYKMGIYMGTLHPQKAYMDGFLGNLVSNPLRGLLEIIHWSPGQRDMSASGARETALATGNELYNEKDKKTGKTKLSGMSTPQRVNYINVLMNGTSVGTNEETLIMRLFETAAPGERPEMYRLIEGHP